MKPNWNDPSTPSWANYLVQYSNGHWAWHESKPKLVKDLGGWEPTGRTGTVEWPDWHKSLEERPLDIKNDSVDEMLAKLGTLQPSIPWPEWTNEVYQYMTIDLDGKINEWLNEPRPGFDVWFREDAQGQSQGFTKMNGTAWRKVDWKTAIRKHET
jgi:hypothetical protein